MSRRAKTTKSTSDDSSAYKRSSRYLRVLSSAIGDVWKRISKHPQSFFFMSPVDPVELEIPDYLDVIKKPMDMGTIKSKIDKMEYKSHDDFADDMALTFRNAYTYNEDPEYPVHIAAKEMERLLDEEMVRLVALIKADIEKSSSMAEPTNDRDLMVRRESSTKTKKTKSTKKGSKKSKKPSGKASQTKRSKKRARKSDGDDSDDAEFGDDSDDDLKSVDDSEGDNDSDDAMDDDASDTSEPAKLNPGDVEYAVSIVLGTQSMTAMNWRKITDTMTTREITRGSVWKQPESEYFDESSTIITKYLVKWQHASFLHVSWETEKDLIELVGKSASAALGRFRTKMALQQDLYEDLCKNEYFPPSFTLIERILDVEDDEVDMQTVDYENAGLPSFDAKAHQDSIIEADAGEEADEMVTGAKQEVAQLAALMGGVGDADLNATAISMNDDEDELFDSDEEREVSELYEGAAATTDDTNVEFDLIDSNSKDAVVEESPSKLIDEAIGFVQSNFSPLTNGDVLQSTSPATTSALNAISGDVLVTAEASSEGVAVNTGSTEVDDAEEEQEMILDNLDALDNVCEVEAVVEKKGPCVTLHSEEAVWVTVKWEGMLYSECTQEDVRDLRSMGIDYETELRNFYKREQLSPSVGTKRANRSVDVQLLEAEECPLLKGDEKELRDYQWEGIRWMLFNWSQNRNSILADEMGLGKTIQSAMLLQHLKTSQGLRGPFLVVAPLTVIQQWKREINLWTDMDAVIYHGSMEERETIRNYDFAYQTPDLKNSKGNKLEVVITTPEVCVTPDNRTSRRALCKIKWDFVIIDEAHKLKNYDSKIATTLRNDFEFSNSLLLTGTPIQNNMEELWSLLNFVDKKVFASRKQFFEHFGDLKDSDRLSELHTLLKPYLLRREKEHVEKKVPPKEEVIVEVDLTGPQKQYYRALYEQKTEFLHGRGMKDGPRLTNLAMELRKCCLHPHLIKGAENELSKHFANDSPVDRILKSSGKMMLLDKLLSKLKRDGHRVLIFSQFRIMLDIIEDYLILRGITFERIDGTITGRKRQHAIDRFSNTGADSKQIDVMLLSTKAGGVGINLTVSDTVIIFDSDWNPQNDVQAQARAHRIGQTKVVKVYRLLTRKTYEAAMFQASSMKLGLDYAVMNGMNGNLKGVSNKHAETFSAMSKKELENLLKHGAYSIFNEDDKEGEGNSFGDEDIEAILSRSKVVHHDENGKMEVGAGFSKASYVASDNTSEESNVEVDDPDFWKKVVGVVDESKAEELSGRRRSRMEAGSYKEPGIRSILDVYESEEESEDEYFDEDADTPDAIEGEVEYTSKNLGKLLNALCSFGYGNWARIKQASRLRWAPAEIAKACRHIIMQLLCWASMGSEVNSIFWDGLKAPKGVNKDCWGFEDLSYFEEVFRTHKASKLAVLALCQEQMYQEPEDLCKDINELFRVCEAMPQSCYFKVAVDPVELEIPDYFDIIKNPMDMGTIKKNLRNEKYKSHALFAEHMKLTFHNAYTYNHMEDNPVHIAAKEMEAAFDDKYAQYLNFIYARPLEDSLMEDAYNAQKRKIEASACSSEMDVEKNQDMDLEGAEPESDNAVVSIFDMCDNLICQDLLPVNTLTESAKEKYMAELLASEDAGVNEELLMMIASLQTLITKNRSLLPADFIENKGGMKNYARNKLRIIEDLFAAYYLNAGTVPEESGEALPWTKRSLPDVACAREREKTSDKTAVTDVMDQVVEDDAVLTAGTATSVDTAETGGTAADVLTAETASSVGASTANTASSVDSSSSIDLTALAAYLHNLIKDGGNKDIESWTSVHDAWLIQQIAKVGAPSGSSKMKSLLEAWKSVAAFTDVLSEEQMAAVFSADNSSTNLLTKRLRSIGMILRVDLEALEAKEAAIKAKALAKEEKANALKAKRAAQLPKTILNLIQKFGRPRQAYTECFELFVKGSSDDDMAVVTSEPAADEDLDSNPYYHSDKLLTTWTSFAKSCHVDNNDVAEMSTLQGIVDALLRIRYESDGSESALNEEEYLKGSGLTFKAIADAIDKADHMHTLRMSLTCMDIHHLKQAITSNCKSAGPNAVPSRRDTALPVYWTVEHDVALIRLVVANGYGNWKKLSSDNFLGQPPNDFVMPPRMQSFEWVTVLSPKLVEKRLLSVLAGLSKYLDQVGKEATIVIPPGSPTRVPKHAAEKGKKKVTSSAKSAPVQYVKGAYQRPSWIAAFGAHVPMASSSSTSSEKSAVESTATATTTASDSSVTTTTSAPVVDTSVKTVSINTKTVEVVEIIEDEPVDTVGKQESKIVAMPSVEEKESDKATDTLVADVMNIQTPQKQEDSTVLAVVTDENKANTTSASGAKTSESLDQRLVDLTDTVVSPIQTDGDKKRSASDVPADSSATKKPKVTKQKKEPKEKKEKKEKKVVETPKMGNIASFFVVGK